MKFNPLLILVVLFMATGCSTQLNLESATVQEWHGGAAGSGGGSKYVVFISKKSGQSLEVNSVWIGDREKGILADYRIFADSSGKMVNKVGDEMGLFRLEMSVQNRRRSGRDDAGGVEGETKAQAGLPEGFQKGILIEYTGHKGKKGYLIAQDLKRLEPLYYP